MNLLYLPELGHFALILAFVFACFQSGIGVLAKWRASSSLSQCVSSMAYGQMLFLTLAYVGLTYAFIMNDFSVYYVAQQGHRLQPWVYRISAVWGAHEGSVLLWAWLLAGWGAAFAYFSPRALPQLIRTEVMTVLGALSTGFLSFLLFTSNPFLRMLPDIPVEGRGLNPLLQDPGLATHPPLLYMGYVGFAVTFALAIAALIEGEFDSRWVRWLKPWVLLAWSFLTIGITLGSWWAYRVLGWGGWWFWDPVENAALLPWLSATALVHCLLMVEKRQAFKAWTILLAIITFCLSLLGTFLVRSGVLISVHAFANDPLRGSFLLKFLWLVLGLAFILFAWRSTKLINQRYFSFFSKETFLLINNVILFVLMMSILFGTLYPLFLEALNLGKISVGPPYFNIIFIPLFLPLMLAMSIGMLCQWQKTNVRQLVKKLGWPIVASMALTIGIMLAFSINSFVRAAALFLSWLLLIVTIQFTYGHARRRLGMCLAHVGVAVCALGIILSTALQVQREVRMKVGESVELGAYQFTLENSYAVTGQNFDGMAGEFVVRYQHQTIANLSPERRHYVGTQTIISQAAIDTNLFRDLYVVLGESLENETWAVRIYHKPFVRMIWLGGLLMGLGGFIALGQRLRKEKRVC